jgi:predicted nuclease of restriction endonuclease-like (RecB) superfamily
LALSRNKKKVKELSRKGLIIQRPEDAVKESTILEFLGLEEKDYYSEAISSALLLISLRIFCSK